MSIGYIWEKFNRAVHHISSSDEPIQRRLVAAYVHDLSSIKTYSNAESLPADLRVQFNEICRRIEQVKPEHGEGMVAVAIKQMTSEEASEIAGLVVSLYDDVTRLENDWRATMGKEKKPPPPSKN